MTGVLVVMVPVLLVAFAFLMEKMERSLYGLDAPETGGDTIDITEREGASAEAA